MKRELELATGNQVILITVLEEKFLFMMMALF